MSDDFWDSLISGQVDFKVSQAVDDRISSKGLGEAFESVRLLTDRGRESAALPLPVAVGTRVQFAGTLGAVLTYEDPPNKSLGGEVVQIRSAHGDLTSYEGKVFVKWDDGKFRSIHAEHLRPAPARKKKGRVVLGDPTTVTGRIPPHVRKIKVAGFGDLTAFLKLADGTLIHKSTQDLWSFNKDADGGLVVERLFDSSGEPLKG